MNEQPLVSVVIPTRNRVRLLQRAIDSVDSQDYSNIELIIVDNAAEEPLRAEALTTSRPIRVVRTPEMLILPRSRNFGASFARGEFISFLDDDDQLMPSKTSSHVSAMMADPGLAFAYGDTRQVGPNGVTIQVASGPAEIVPYLHHRYIHTNALTIRRTVFESLRYSEDMSTYEDVEFAGRLLLSHRGVHVPEVHALWYRDNRPDQMTRRNWRRAHANWKRLCSRFHDVIVTDRDLRRFYHRKMLILALMFRDVPQVLNSMRLLV